MVGPGMQERHDQAVRISNIGELKSAITSAVYRAMLFWFLTVLGVVFVFGLAGFMISLPKFAQTKELAYQAAMKSDLRNLITAEEDYFADSVKYTTSVPGFVVTPGNVLGPIKLTGDGWTATISSVNTSAKCAIFIGKIPIAPAEKEGFPTCVSGRIP